MKKITIAIVTILIFSVSAAYAQKRIKFPAGKNSIILKGTTTGGPSESGGMNPVSYVVRANKGQTMTLRLTSAKKNAVFAVYLPGMTDFLVYTTSKPSWSGKLPKTGDYEILVFPEDEITNTAFTLEIIIR
jgi:hypothetical protein